MWNRLLKNSQFLAILGLLSLPYFLTPVLAETFNVTDVDGFQTALTTAASNDQDDVINVAAGKYDLNAPAQLSYDAKGSSENWALTIQGAGPGKTIIDGGDAYLGLWINTNGFTDDKAHIVVRDIGVQHAYSDGQGGGIYIRTNMGNVKVKNVSVDHNAAYFDGGGLYVYTSLGTAVLDKISATNNNAGGAGGGAFIIAGDDLTIVNSAFVGNEITKDGTGGGLFAQSSFWPKTLIVKDCRFHNNHAIATNAMVGGAYLETQKTGMAIFFNNTLSGNTSQYGGGAYFNGGDMIVANNTLSGNHGELAGGGMTFEMQGGTAYIANNIVRGNTTAGVGADFDIGDADSSHIAVLSNNDYSDLHRNNGGGTVTIDATNIDLDPLFVASSDPDPGKWDLHLTANSPAIDSGDNIFITADVPTDRDGDSRILDGNGDGTATVDMGSDEYKPPAPSPAPSGNNTSGGGGGGCSMHKGTGIDPLLPLLVFGALVYLLRRYRFCGR